MNARTLTITLQPDWRAALLQAGQLAFSHLTERRWAMVNALQGHGEMAVRELARRVGRDVKRVHEDAQALIELGLIERTDTGGLLCPFAQVHIDMHMHAPQPLAA